MTMVRKFLLAVAIVALVAPCAVSPVVAEDAPPAGAPAAPQAAAPDDPDGQPYPPDGVTDPNAVYPTDGAGDTTDQGEAGAAAPVPAPAPGTPPAGDAPAN